MHTHTKNLFLNNKKLRLYSLKLQNKNGVGTKGYRKDVGKILERIMVQTKILDTEV